MIKLYNLPNLIFTVFVLLICNSRTDAQFLNTIGGTGTGSYNSDGISALNAHINAPMDVAVDANGNVFVADRQNHRIRKISSTGTITTIAGTGTAGYNGDAISATTAQLNQPTGLAFDATGNLYIADAGNHRIRMVNTSGTISTVAGTGTAGYNGDITATSAQINNPAGVFVDNSGYVYIADAGNNRVRVITAATNILTTIAGTGTAGFNNDGILANTAQLNNPQDVAVDGSGNVYIADYGNHRVRMINANSNIVTIAGTGTPGYSGEYAGAAVANLNNPASVAINGSILYISDAGNNRVRYVLNGTIYALAGNGAGTHNVDGHFPLWTSLKNPAGIAVTATGSVYIADNGNNRVKLASNTWYRDNDADGFGKSNISVAGLLPATGYIENDMDCNDSSSNAAQWVDLGQAGFSKAGVNYCNMTTNKAGHPVMAYQDAGNGSKATVMVYSGGGWSAIGSEAFSAGTVTYMDVALDASDAPYVVFCDGANSNKVTVMKYSSGSWAIVGAAGFSATAATYTSIALDGKGNPYVAFRDASGKANVMTFNGVFWVSVGGVGISPGTITAEVKIAIDGAGNPYIVFGDQNSSGKTTVMKYNGTNWVTVGSAGISGGTTAYNDILIDNSGSPYVAFADGGNSSKAVVMKFDGSTWTNLYSAGFSAAAADWVSIARDNSGNIFIAFTDVSNSNKATLVKYTGTGFINVGGVAFSPGATSYTNVILDRQGIPSVCYRDAANSNKASAMSINVKPKLSTTPVFSGNTPICNGDPTVLSISGGTLNDAANWKWYTGSCGGTALSTNMSLAVTPSVNTKYYARAEGPCLAAPGICDSISVTVNPVIVPVVTLSASPDTNLFMNLPVTFTANVVNPGPNPTYQWYRGATLVTGVTGPTYNAGAVQDGDLICVHLTSDATCAKPSLATDCANIHIDLGVDDVKNQHNISLSPNPNSGRFTLSAAIQGNDRLVNVEIINSLGQIVHKEEVIAENGMITKFLDLKSLPHGIYLVQLVTSASKSSTRLVLQ